LFWPTPPTRRLCATPCAYGLRPSLPPPPSAVMSFYSISRKSLTRSSPLPASALQRFRRSMLRRGAHDSSNRASAPTPSMHGSAFSARFSSGPNLRRALAGRGEERVNDFLLIL